MRQRRSVWFTTIGLIVLAMSGAAIAVYSMDKGGDPSEFTPVKDVRSQSRAIAEAQKVDLPLVATADKVVIQAAGFVKGGATATLDQQADIDELRQGLKPSSVPPSGGVTAAEIMFYRGDTLLRTVWVFDYGEWGFKRPGTSWTTGSNGKLWKTIEKHLK